MPLFLAIITLFLAVSEAFAAGMTGASDTSAIPDLNIARGGRNIAEAWLIAPTQVYPHYVEGTQYEAGGLRLLTSYGDNITLMLDGLHVFEDRYPRLADLDGDGRDEIIVVLTSVQKGSSLAAYSVQNGEIVLKAQTPFIGQPFRWLNPAGIADFNGDGHPDVAFVAMPHLAKRLEIWTLRESRFQRLGYTADAANHRNGSPYTQMSAIADFNDDDIADLAIPNGDRTAIQVLSYAGGKWLEIDRKPLPAPADGNFKLIRQGKNYRLIVPMENGEIAELAL